MRSARVVAAWVLLATGAVSTAAVAQGSCTKPVYLTFDTGHMGVAPLVAEVLKRQDVRVTFFGAAEPKATNSRPTLTTMPTGAAT
jgi:peptidoglycan/xylan/chitin deacetylase (PgdA/CDA1 family)